MPIIRLGKITETPVPRAATTLAKPAPRVGRPKPRCDIALRIIKAATRRGTRESVGPDRLALTPGARLRRRRTRVALRRTSATRARGRVAHEEHNAALVAASMADDDLAMVRAYRRGARNRSRLRFRRGWLPQRGLATLRRDRRHARPLSGYGRDVAASALIRGERPLMDELVPIPAAASVALRPREAFVPALITAAG